MDITVRQDGNFVAVDYEYDSIFLDISGRQLGPLALDFAVWLMLPLAMRRGEALHIRGDVDAKVLDNARQLARIWTMWIPSKYKSISITAEGCATRQSERGDAAMLLFSGGVDSTFALLSRVKADHITHALTLHGLDYDFDDAAPFAALLRKTAPLLGSLGVERTIIRTDAGRKIRDLGLTHGFILASCLFVFSRHLAKGMIAADLTPEQDMMVFPWGTNHVTNQYFSGAAFRMETVSLQASRIEKLDQIARDPVALRSISFCGDKRMRPANCGRCPKCLRTKTMLIALNGESPRIFLDNEISESQIAKLDVASNAAYKHYAEIVQVARMRGHLDRIPGLERRVDHAIAMRQRQGAVSKYLHEAARIVGLA